MIEFEDFIDPKVNEKSLMLFVGLAIHRSLKSLHFDCSVEEEMNDIKNKIKILENKLKSLESSAQRLNSAFSLISDENASILQQRIGSNKDHCSYCNNPLTVSKNKEKEKKITEFEEKIENLMNVIHHQTMMVEQLAENQFKYENNLLEPSNIVLNKFVKEESLRSEYEKIFEQNQQLQNYNQYLLLENANLRSLYETSTHKKAKKLSASSQSSLTATEKKREKKKTKRNTLTTIMTQTVKSMIAVSDESSSPKEEKSKKGRTLRRSYRSSTVSVKDVKPIGKVFSPSNSPPVPGLQIQQNGNTPVVTIHTPIALSASNESIPKDNLEATETVLSPKSKSKRESEVKWTETPSSSKSKHKRSKSIGRSSSTPIKQISPRSGDRPKLKDIFSEEIKTKKSISDGKEALSPKERPAEVLFEEDNKTWDKLDAVLNDLGVSD